MNRKLNYNQTIVTSLVGLLLLVAVYSRDKT
jgi:hypothetical protein